MNNKFFKITSVKYAYLFSKALFDIIIGLLQIVFIIVKSLFEIIGIIIVGLMAISFLS